MMKEFKIEEIMPLEAVKSKIWMMFDILRSENISSDDYHVVLFLLSAFKDNLISTDLINENHHIKESLIERLRNSNYEYYEQYAPIIQSFEPSIQRLSENGIRHLFNALVEINKQVLTENFPDVFDSVLYRISQSQGRYAVEFIQPVELTRFMCGLADLKKDAKVFNPFAGLASFGVYLDQGQDYFGQELNQKTWALGALRLIAYERPGRSRYVCDDSILHWPHESENFDLILSNPPFGMRLGNQYRDIEPSIKTIEQFLIEKGVQSLKQNGNLIALLPQGFLFRGMQEQRLREHLVEEDLIDTIISLPGGLLLNTGIPLVILILSKNKKLAGKVKFVDAKKFVVARGPREKVLNDVELRDFLLGAKEDDNIIQIVDNKQIRDCDYNLSVPRYFYKPIEGVKLGNLIAPIRGKRTALPKYGRFIRIRDLSQDKLDFKLDLSQVDMTELSRPYIELISESCLLLTTRWKTLRPTLFEYQQEPIFKGLDVMAFKVDAAKVDINYLIYELNSDYVREQLESFQIGSVVPFIQRSDLMDIVIKLPSIEDQKRSIIEKGLTLLNSEQNRIKELSKTHNLVVEDDNSVLRHRIAGRINNLSGAIDGLNQIISSQVIEVFPDFLNLKKSSKSTLTIGKYLDILRRDISIIKNFVSKDYQFQISSSFKEFDFITFLKDYVSELNNAIHSKSVPYVLNNPSYIFEEDLLSEMNIKELIVEGDESDLKTMLDNLEENSVKHGFKGQTVGRNKISISCKIDDENMKVILSFFNSGNPLPNGFNLKDFKRNGITSDINIGDGYGGYLISKIIENHNGELTCEDLSKTNINSEYVTVFNVLLPIKDIVI